MVTGLSRRELLGAGGAALLAGCAVVDPGEAPPVPAPPPAGPAVLTPWLTLLGGWAAPVGGLPGLPLPGAPPVPPLVPPVALAPGGAGRQNFRLPMGLAARDDTLMVADAGWRQVLRVDRQRDSITPFAPFTPLGEASPSLHLAGDGSLWLADPSGGRVLQFDRFGRLRQTLRDDRIAARPVAVVAPDPPGEVFVADASDAQIAVFSPFGLPLRRFGQGTLQSVSALASGPEGLYVLDRLAQQVLVFGPDGRVRRTIGGERLVQPHALAVDREGRVFVGDDGGQRIHVFSGGDSADAFGGPGNGPGRFGRIDGLAVDGHLLHVADSVNARVQILLISPPSLLRRKAG